jgi:hypothetical protein
MKHLVRVFFLFFLITYGATSCATVQQATVKTNNNYKKAWKSCLDSLADVQFSASSTDYTAGLIVADQAVVSGHGTVSRMNIQLSKESKGIIVTIKFVPPPFTVGGQGTTDAYVEALKKRLPDLKTIVDK